MSLRSRARRLQRATGLTYQRALIQIRAHAAEAAAMARERGWPLGRCDLELAGVATASPIDVVDVSADPSDPITACCYQLLVQASARAVTLVGPGVQVHVGSDHAHATVLAALAQTGDAQLLQELEGGLCLCADRVNARGTTVGVLFDGQSSVGLVRLRMRGAVDELARLLEHRAERVARLVYRDGDGREGGMQLQPACHVLIGRGLQCDIRGGDPRTSRRHAVVRGHGGHYSIQDISHNGTRVNGAKIEHRALRHGDVITCGGLTVRFVYPDGSAASPPPPRGSDGPTGAPAEAWLSVAARRRGDSN